jgi:putative transposase
MVRYRRNRVPGGTFFFTVTLRNRRSDLLVTRIDALREAWRLAKVRVPHEVIAAIVLPEHLHAVIAMRDATADYPRLWQDIKEGFTRRVQPAGLRSPWQARYWEHTLRDEDDLRRHVDYVHINPLKHGLVDRASDWPHSTFHRYVARGLLPFDWGGGP